MVGICSTNPALTHECTVVIKVTELGACTRCQVHHNIPSCWPCHSDLPLRQRRGAEVEGLQAGVPLVFYQGAHTGSAVCWRVKWAQAEHTEQQLMQPDPIGVPSIFGTLHVLQLINCISGLGVRSEDSLSASRVEKHWAGECAARLVMSELLAIIVMVKKKKKAYDLCIWSLPEWFIGWWL